MKGVEVEVEEGGEVHEEGLGLEDQEVVVVGVEEWEEV